MKDEVSASSFKDSNFMVEITEAFWHTLIISEKEKGFIKDGLTIPFIIGAKTLVNKAYVADGESVRLLLSEIIHSSTENVAVLRYCGRKLGDYIIAIQDRKFADGFGNKISFYNDNNEKTMTVNNDVSSRLGESIEEISENLNTMYLQLLTESKFSCDEGIWRKFEQNEISRIEELQK